MNLSSTGSRGRNQLSQKRTTGFCTKTISSHFPTSIILSLRWHLHAWMYVYLVCHAYSWKDHPDKLTPSQRLFRPSRHGDATTDPVVTYFSQKRISAAAKSLSVFIAVAILIVPVSILVWTPWNRTWISVTVLLSVLIFSTLLSLSTKIKAKDVLLGSAAWVYFQFADPH